MSKTAEEILIKHIDWIFASDHDEKCFVRAMEEYAKLKTSELEKEIEKQKELYLGLKELGEERISKLEKEVKDLRELISKIPDLLHDSLGNRENEYTIKDFPENSCVDSGEFWITHNEVGSGEPLKQWIKSEIDKSLNK